MFFFVFKSTTKKEKTADMFKLMWSMKKKGDKPHYNIVIIIKQLCWKKKNLQERNPGTIVFLALREVVWTKLACYFTTFLACRRGSQSPCIFDHLVSALPLGRRELPLTVVHTCNRRVCGLSAVHQIHQTKGLAPLGTTNNNLSYHSQGTAGGLWPCCLYHNIEKLQAYLHQLHVQFSQSHFACHVGMQRTKRKTKQCLDSMKDIRRF